jgi:hypothetical protein
VIWSEAIIAGEIARQTLDKKCVVLVDNCNWTGHECDVLGVTTDLRIIDVEVKISRSDLKADAKKDKWWHRQWGRYNPQTRDYDRPPDILCPWPPKVWKHYYALPAEIWTDDLLGALPSPMSGVLLLSKKPGEFMQVRCLRRATPCRDATRLKPESVMDIARLANLRMWDAYRDAERARQELAWHREQNKVAA